MKRYFCASCVALSTFFCIPTNAASQEPSCVKSDKKVDEAIPGWKTVSPNVGINDLVQINSHGDWYYCSPCTATTVNGLKVNPSDAPGPEHLFHPGSTIGTLIGIIGNGDVFSIGSDIAFTSKDKGPLKVRMNDLAAAGDNPTDNSGVVNVSLKLCRPSP